MSWTTDKKDRNYHPDVQAGNPGGADAVAKGCTCPVLANAFGDGYAGLHGRFAISPDCPLHSDEALRRRREEEGQ